MAPECDKDIAKDLPDFDSLWNFDRPDESEAKFRELLTRAETLGADKRYQAELLTQIARTEGLQRRFDEGRRTLDRAEAMLADAPPRVRVRCLLERGRLFNSSGKSSDAIPLFQAAFDKAQAAGEDALAIDAAHMLGICETPQKAMEWNLRALAAAQAARDPKARHWAGSLLNNIGWACHEQKEFAKALGFFNRALAFQQERGNAREIRIARWAVARTLRSLGRIDEALVMQRDLRSQWEIDKGEDGYVYEELGECLLALGNEEAGRWFAEAYRALSADQWLAAREPKRLERLKELATR